MPLAGIRQTLREALYENEEAALRRLLPLADTGPKRRQAVADRAARIVAELRETAQPTLMEGFLAEYGLSTREGVALMCLAEAMLRTPDAETVDDLIRDKIAPHDWSRATGDSHSLMLNASVWALMLTGKILDDEPGGLVGTLRGMARRLGEPVIRLAVGRAMREMGAQFVLGRDIHEALAHSAPWAAKGYVYSYDMLGEAARTDADAARYHGAYAQAIAALTAAARSDDVAENPGISVKLSALHPRYERLRHETTLPELAGRTLQLARAAASGDLGFNIDAEESDRLDLSLDIVERVLSDSSLKGWSGFGVVVQAYGPRAAHTLDWLYALAERLDRRIMVRLVKGAYWDAEIKRAQTLGAPGFPVFTRKSHTDLSYLACARKLMRMRGRIYGQFATHNAHTAAAVLELSEGDRRGFELQRLHGMGEALHEWLRLHEGARTRIYAPVGAHRDLLAYLVRRLLENGANSSFVNQIMNKEVPPAAVARDPVEEAQAGGLSPNPLTTPPADLFRPQRANSKGWDLTDPLALAEIEAARAPFKTQVWRAGKGAGPLRRIVNPARPGELVGEAQDTTPEEARAMVGAALAAQGAWGARGAAERAAMLNRAADLYEANYGEIFALLAREAGKTLPDAVAELREAVDFLRYYAAESLKLDEKTRPRGAIVCVSPWNFPLAIFTGQVAAALAAGNAVIAKPAEQTPLIAARAVDWLHEAGIPADVLALAPGDGPGAGAALTSDPRIGGVCFTGSTEVAKIIDRQLAQSAPGAMLIAETGGLNAMIVDSTALPEQAARDILASAFQSAGQRCSALRILYVQRDVEERVLEMVQGAMDKLRIGDPWDLATDVGPLIDAEAQGVVLGHLAAMDGRGRVMKRLETPAEGVFAPPALIRLKGVGEMEREIFGPALHVARFDAERLDETLAEINARGYGLTLGFHSRIDRRMESVIESAHVGNLYVNRNQIGAVVGSQPFGGEGLSGTGPKAGGPHYLPKFRAPLEAAPAAPAGRKVLGAEAEALLKALDASEWAARRDRVEALRAALRGKAAAAMAAAAALDEGPVDLPGPTGESNRLSLVPRGRALCLGPDAESALDQAVQALRLGNAVLAVAPGAAAALTPLIKAGLPAAALDGRLEPEAAAAIPADAIALAGGDAVLRRAMAARPGPIRPLVAARIDPAAYAHERALCVDTTAAGGNAALLAQGG